MGMDWKHEGGWKLVICQDLVLIFALCYPNNTCVELYSMKLQKSEIILKVESREFGVLVPTCGKGQIIKSSSKEHVAWYDCDVS